MNWLTTISILILAFLAVFWQAGFALFRNISGAQIELLPGLVVYAALRTNMRTLALLAVIGGLGLDSLSANPLATSVLPLFAVGVPIYLKRDLIMKDQIVAQAVLGAVSSLAVPVLTLLVMLTKGMNPLLGWGTLWQLLVMTVGGSVVTPLWFVLFAWFDATLVHSSQPNTSFRPDREIRRGRA